MSKRVRLVKYSKEVDGNLLWYMYNSEDYSEFFRRIEACQDKQNILNFPENYHCALYTVLFEETPIGFCVLQQIDPFGQSAQAGLMLHKEYQNKKCEELPLAFHAIYRLAELCFDKSSFRKLSFRFLKSREDIAKSFEKSGLKKEAELKENVLYRGNFVDELEYSLFKDYYNQVKGTICLN